MNWRRFVEALSEDDIKQLRSLLSGQLLTSDEYEMIRQHNHIGAIKSVKDRLCVSLREAKDIVQSAV